MEFFSNLSPFAIPLAVASFMVLLIAVLFTIRLFESKRDKLLFVLETIDDSFEIYVIMDATRPEMNHFIEKASEKGQEVLTQDHLLHRLEQRMSQNPKYRGHYRKTINVFRQSQQLVGLPMGVTFDGQVAFTLRDFERARQRFYILDGAKSY